MTWETQTKMRDLSRSLERMRKPPINWPLTIQMAAGVATILACATYMVTTWLR